MKPGRITLCIAWIFTAVPVAAQVPVESLAKPPADAQHYVIESSGGKHGDSWLWTKPDGTRMNRESMNLRGMVWEIDQSGTPGADRMPAKLTVRGVNPQGDASETFAIATASASWKSPVDAGSAPYKAPAFYSALDGGIDAMAWLTERLIASPTHAFALLPTGAARAEKLGSLDVQGPAGSARSTVDLWAVSGLNTSPTPVWAYPDGRFFAFTAGLGWLPEAYAGEQAKLEKAQDDAMAAQTARLAERLLKPAGGGAVAFVHVRVFDAEALRFLADQSVIVDQGKIVAVGAADAVSLPARTRIVDGRGKTLLPGLWDCHMHVSDDYTGVQELSLGVTSMRDPGNDDLKTLDRRARAAAGTLLFPHVYPSSLIDGKGPYTAQVANVATSQAQAIALVDQAKERGFTGVKFYGSFDPAWLPATIAEAHKLGLHVHGHIPAGIRPTQAIDDGYDEVTHINWVMMEAMPDSVIPVDNGIMRFEGPGRYAKDVDLEGSALTRIVKTMAAKRIYSDPTMVAFEGIYVRENGELAPSYAPFVGTLPPAAERGFRQGGFAVPKDLTRADYRASWAKMVGLLKKMHEAGVPAVAGTDGSGIELIRELEIYEQAGFTPAQALAAATIVPARLVGQEERTGSITVGKNADLVLVEGDPAQDMAAMRQTRLVMLDGKLFDTDELRTAAGYSGRPR